jgi:hypothetical protein
MSRLRAAKYINRDFQLKDFYGGCLTLLKSWSRKERPDYWGPKYDGLTTAHYLAIGDINSNKELLELAAGTDQDQALVLQPCSNGFLLSLNGYQEYQQMQTFTDFG